MLRFGSAPFLECSSRGDKRFSAFFATINGRCIEEQYQSAKRFDMSTPAGRAWSIRHWSRKHGLPARNYEECARLYESLWRLYIVKNPELLDVLKNASGLSDIFGQVGHQCQAEVLWRLRNEALKSAT